MRLETLVFMVTVRRIRPEYGCSNRWGSGGSAVDLLHLAWLKLDVVGPACGVMVLTIFYTLIWKLLIWLPRGRWLRVQSRAVVEESA